MHPVTAVSDPVVQKILTGLVLGLLLGLGNKISRRLLEVASAIGALVILFFMFSSRQDNDMTVYLNFALQWIVLWKFELLGTLIGAILGYSIIEQRERREK